MEKEKSTLLLDRLGKKVPSSSLHGYGCKFELLKLCDGLEGTTLDLKPLEADILIPSEYFSKAHSSLKFDIQPNWTSREVEALTKALIKSGEALSSPSLIRLIDTGMISAWNVPELLDEALKRRSLSTLQLILSRVRDIRELDIAKILLFCLGCRNNSAEWNEAETLMRKLFTIPFREKLLMGYLKNYGTVQIEELFQVLLDLLDSEGYEALALNWISLLIDTHYALLLIQPSFLPYLKRLHERIGGALVVGEEAELTVGLLSAILTHKSDLNPAAASQRLVVTEEYIIDRGIDL